MLAKVRRFSLLEEVNVALERNAISLWTKGIFLEGLALEDIPVTIFIEGSVDTVCWEDLNENENVKVFVNRAH